MGMTAKSGYEMTKKVEGLLDILTLGVLATSKAKSKCSCTVRKQATENKR